MENKACPECRKQGHDKTGDHLWLMKDGNRWCCEKGEYHLSGKVYYEVEGEVSVPEEGEEDLSVEDTLNAIIDGAKVDVKLPDIRDMLQGVEAKVEVVKEELKVGCKDMDVQHDYRWIPPHIFKQYEVYGSYEGAELKRLSHPIYEIGGGQVTIKYRELPKDFRVTTSTGGVPVELFGQRNARSSKTLVITEGEIDAMSLEYILSTSKYAKPAIVSLPFGANKKAMMDNDKFIQSYDKLVICADDDTAGRKFSREVASLYPDALFMDLGGSKDLNQMLQDGKGPDMLSAYFSASSFKPDSLVDISKLKASLSKPIPMGYSTPWPSLDGLIYGISKGAIISVAAAPSAGKTVFVRAIHKELMEKHGIKVGIYSLEESPETVLRNLVAYEMGVAIGVPGVSYNATAAAQVATKLEKDCLIYDSSHYNGDWKAMVASMRQFCALGMEVAIVDPVSSLVIGKSSSDGNELLGIIMGDMIKLTQETGLSVILVNHLNNAKGKSHEEGGRVLASEMTGSRSQYRYSSLILGLERDILNSDADIRDTLKVRVLKSRLDGSKSGKVCELVYDQTLKRLIEKPRTTKF